jgi:hypothetical protein
MRLGQLARKLALSPSDIIEYLAAQQLPVNEGANTRLEDNQVELVLQRFAPEGLKQELLNPEVVKKVEPASNHPVVVEFESQPEIVSPITFEVASEDAGTETSVIQEENTTPDAETTPLDPDKVETIKAPKVALSGLKVLGKIELKEKKKQTETPAENSDVALVAEEAQTSEVAVEVQTPPTPSVPVQQPRRENRRPDQYRQERRDERPRKNPIALAREREAQAEEEKRQAEAKRKKEQRTLNYQKRVKTAAPTKAARLIKEEYDDISSEDLRPEPKTWLGKFWKWFRS